MSYTRSARKYKTAEVREGEEDIVLSVPHVARREPVGFHAAFHTDS